MLRKSAFSWVAPLLVIILGLTLASACSPGPHTKQTTAMTLANSFWELTSLNGQPINSQRPPTLNFEATRLGGYAGCNRFFGSYSSSNDGTFSTGTLGATKMACIGKQNELEQQYFQALGKASQFAIIRDQLHLLDSERNILMIFAKTKAPDNKSQ